ncbi:Gfo/Idh/MocA family protein [Nakamurella lactea]|uniref:Gfo/Idh/MocA family protein n=1 Tax=Nakamurella lactea TaxID=459515 RepID=UPI00041C0410|nr:Gfo/Idh/MocA family oxidoreductase [Nakamurella lactea]
MTAGLAVAIVGAGRMGQEHAAALTAAGDRVRWVIDADPRSAAALAGAHGAESGTDLDRLLATTTPDAVVIATPSEQHLSQALRCAHLPTLLEKPPWLGDQDPTPLVAASRVAGRLVAVGMTTRFDPAICSVQKAVSAGRIGQVLSIDDTINFVLGDESLPAWYHQPHHRGGGIVQTNGVHALDRVSWILGELPRLVTARAGSTARTDPIEDSATIVLTTDTASVTVNVLWSQYEPPPTRLTVVGTLGTATAFADGSWQVTTIDGTEQGAAAPDRNNYLTQWHAFRAALADPRAPSTIPTVYDLVGPMTLLSQTIATLDIRG